MALVTESKFSEILSFIWSYLEAMSLMQKELIPDMKCGPTWNSEVIEFKHFLKYTLIQVLA